MKRLLLFVMCLLPGLLFAESISLKQAESIANQFFFGTRQTTRHASLHLVWDGEDAHTRSSASPAFYVFNADDDHGFVIVAGDDVSEPILGYSFEGNFVVEGMPQEVRSFYNSYRDNINEARQSGVKCDARIRESWQSVGRQTRAADLELGSAKWNQRAPYNLETPVHPNGGHCLTGCVATATSIVMYAHKHPLRGDGKTLGAYFAPTEQVNCPAVTYNQPYEWDKMLADYNNGYTDEEGQAVARLMHHVGHGIEMDYGVHVSNSTLLKSAAFLRNHMDYSPAITVKNISDYGSAVAWAEALRQELDKGYPIVFSGYNPSRGEGHAFVLDGYHGDGTFGVNLGWGGKNNGYYQLDHIPSGWNNAQSAIFNMRPKKPGEKEPDILKFVTSGVGDFGIIINKDGLKVQANEAFTLKLVGLQNPSSGKFNCELMVAMVDNYDNVIEKIASKEGFVADGAVFTLDQDFGTVTITKPIEAGYRLRAYYILESGDRMMVEGNAQTHWEVRLRPDPAPQPDPDPEPIEVVAPTFSPVEGRVDKGTEVTISSVTEKASIHYTLNEGKEVIGQNPVTLTINEDTYISAYAMLDEIKSDVVSAVYTIKVARPESKNVFMPVADETQLREGQTLLIIGLSNDGHCAALGQANSENTYRMVMDVKVLDDKSIHTDFNEDGLPYAFQLGKEDTRWTLQNALDNKYLSLEKDANALHTNISSGLEGAQWTITFDAEGHAQIQNVQYAERSIYYNSNNGSARFACYKATSNQNPVCLYALMTGTSINKMNREAGGQVKVYDVNGILVRVSGCVEEALDNLSEGIYIINGRKVLIR